MAQKKKKSRKEKNSILEWLKKVITFSEFSGLKSNNSKCKIACSGVLKAVEMAQRGMKCVNFKKRTLKSLEFIYLMTKNLNKKRTCVNIFLRQKTF